MESIENILAIFTTEKEKDTSLLKDQKSIEETLGKFKKCKKAFNAKKKRIVKDKNYDLPLQSNENSSKSCSFKDEKTEDSMKKGDFIVEKATPTKKTLETSNNLNYSPSMVEALSFYDQLKESKNSKINVSLKNKD